MPDGRVREQLTRGARIREALRQGQHTPFRLVDEVALMLAVQTGLLDPLPLDAVKAFRCAIPKALDTDAGIAVQTMDESGTLDDDARDVLLAALSRLAIGLTPAEPAQKT